MTRNRLSLLCKALIAVLTLIAWQIMMRRSGGALSSTGLRNLRYFTVLSNLLCGLTALIHAIALAAKRTAAGWVLRLSFIGTTAVSVTLMVVMLFLGALYGYLNMLQGANLWFHLVIPLLAILDHWLLEPGEAGSLRDTLLALIPTVLYGAFYLGNILVNGVGEWPDTNDWYAFTAWGMPVGIGIFAAITALTWGAALALRALRRSRMRRTAPTGGTK